MFRTVSIPAPGWELSIRRTYDSRSRYRGVFGYGWHTELDVRVVPLADGERIGVIEADGTIQLFEWDDKASAYVSARRGWQTIARTPDEGFVRSFGGGRQQIFDRLGRVDRMTDPSGNELAVWSDR